MNDYIKEYVKEQLHQRKVGIFGTGSRAYAARMFLDDIGIFQYVYFDNDVGKVDNNTVLDPSEINDGYFILISTVYFQEIKMQLDSIGLKEMQDYIWVLDLEYYDALIQYKDEPRVPDLTFQDLDRIEESLKRYVDVVGIDWFNESDFKKYEKQLGFENEYNKIHNPRYRRKIMEYYCVDKLLGFNVWNKDDIYVDIGACGSPFAKYLREKRKIKAYAVDISEGKYENIEYYIKEDATKMHFGDGELRGISAQSAFEMFVGTADIDLIKEISRCLKQKGRAIICPLYMHRKYLSTVSPNYYHKGFADPGSLECIRTDCGGGIPLGRFYDAESLNRRILITARQYGLKPVIHSLPQEVVEKDAFVYLKFILCLEKA